MFSCVVAGLGHPLIHLGYAVELNSREVAMEAMGLAATCYDERWARTLERGMARKPPDDGATGDLFEVFERVRMDERLDGVFERLGDDNLSVLLGDEKLTEILLDHFATWKITDPTKDFAQSQALATALLIASNPAKPVKGHGWDFFLVHLLTTSHAVRTLIPWLDAKYHLSLVKEWFLIMLAIYIAQLRPKISTSWISEFDLKERDWKHVEKKAVEGEHRFDAHYVKALRAMREGERVWGEKGSVEIEKYWLKSAVMFADGFEKWGGFDETSEEGMN
jgi:hypothetical protein